MSALDVIPIPGHPGMYARRAFIDAWTTAGSPPLNSAGRLYGEQKRLYDGWVNRKPGFNPADNPDDERQALAHVRFVAGDIDPTPERVRRLAAAGLIRPYSYEPWHWELPNVRQYAIVRAIPKPTPTTTPEQSEEDDMSKPLPLIFKVDPGGYWVLADMEERTYSKVANDVQKDFYINTKRAEPIHGLQPISVIAKFTERP
ncbi:hypothetical protein [Microbacterium sp. GCS4]|uniref:hypothetical protein n=1 Tax=Microbacterium sp. GCS4 TaxID=1692239 RepID=UPI0006802757|nr:hypothetical protein [Microbacterium sp. GCS4]KNY07912.1 hypothetical protein AKH00_06760 [Microbacterium sp. GCS4]